MWCDMGNLTAAQVRNLRTPGRYSDGNTLIFVVTKGRRRYWLQRLTVHRKTVHRKRRDVILGDYGEKRKGGDDPTLLSLADARAIAEQNRRRARQGEDPFAMAMSGAVPTFGEALDRVLESVKNEVRTPERVRAWLHPLEKHALHRLRDIPVDRIGRQEVLAVVEPLWNTKHETAQRVRRKIHRVLSWAQAQGFVDVNFAGEIIDGALRSRGREHQHHRMAPYFNVPEMWRTVSAASGSPATRLCLQLLLCTAVRSGEARLAEWSEIDCSQREWRIPAVRTKTRKDLRQPLSAPALEVLEQAKELNGGPTPSGYIFPSPDRRGAPLSTTALLALLERSGLRDLTTVHGLRASFRTWASDETSTDFAVMELSLGHKVGSEVVRAYDRAELLAKRRLLMCQWGAFLTGTVLDWEFLLDASRVVVPLHALRRDGARHWVRVFDPSCREPCDREVMIGQITLAGAEIASGLAPGDQVLLPVR